MGLNNVRLSSQNVVDLYKNQLLETSSISAGMTAPVAVVETKPEVRDEITKVEQEPAKTFTFLGKNAKNLTILVNYPNEVYLPEQQLSFISNILKACNMNLADIAIVNTALHSVSLKMITGKLDPKYIVIFGLNPLTPDIKNELTDFNILTVRDVQIFSSPELEQLNQTGDHGKLLKSKLWLCMKKMLNL